MIGMLKRWFVTHEEVKGLYGQLETMALSYQELVREQQSMREQLGLDAAQIGVHRPKGYILNGGRPAADIYFQRTENLKARKLPAKPVTVEGPDANPVALDDLAKQTRWHVTGVTAKNDTFPKHIANARLMIAKAGGHSTVRQLVKQGKLHAFLQASPVLDKGKVYQGGKVTLYNRGKHTATNAKRYSMVLHSTTQAREVTNYFRSIGIPVKESTK